MITVTDEMVEAALQIHYLSDEDRAAGVRWHHGLSGDLAEVAQAVMRSALESAFRLVPKAVGDIAAERQRQVSVEGWTPEHDDQHRPGDLACAAGCYAIHAGLPDRARVPKGYSPQDWPWDHVWWKPKDRRRDLVRAGALIAAEIERLDRMPKAETEAPSP